MKTRLFLFAIMLALPCFLFSQEAQQYEYVTMIQTGKSIYESRAGEALNEIDIKDELSDHKEAIFIDFGPLLKRVEAMEKEGWNLVTSTPYYTGTGAHKNYVLMRRKKP